MYSHAEKAHLITKPTRPDPATVAAKKAEIKLRYRQNKKRKQPFAIASKRVAELRRLFKARYGKVLPDDDAGRDDAKIMLDHMAACAGAFPVHLETFLHQSCPWMAEAEIEKMTTDAMAKPIRYRADTLAKRLAVEFDRTVGAVVT